MEEVGPCSHAPIATKLGVVCAKCGLIFEPAAAPAVRIFGVGRITASDTGGLEAALGAIDAKHNPGLPDDDLDEQYRDEED